MSGYEIATFSIIAVSCFVAFVFTPTWLLWTTTASMTERRFLRLAITTGLPALIVAGFGWWLSSMSSDEISPPTWWDSMLFSLPLVIASATTTLGICLALEWLHKKQP
ncbi:hypothetical protein [Lysobacter sp. cf310]|uniref:hypothetical protein n=1 Tax=Lysobacter sp. cf310 TaxID=1761790 RepID=UPI000B82B3AA|nr:hypothetical protein [Lysobacter sp. cf310]